MTKLRIELLALGVFALTFNASAAMAEFESDELRVTVGPGIIVSPKFEGADEYEATPVPYVDIRYGEVFFASYIDGIGARLVNWNGFSAGPVARVDFGRDEDDSRYLTGLDDIEIGVELGGFLQYDYDRYFTTRLELRQAISGHDGFVADWKAAVKFRLAENVFGSVGPQISYGGSNYMESYFGISPAQSLASGYAVYDADAGFKSAGVNANLIYRATEEISLAAFGGYKRLIGDAADSPIVKGPGGSPDQFFAGAALTYTFGF
jgi:outer membrane protein